MARQQLNRRGGMLGFLVGLLSGFVIGSVFALLFAPHRGDVTRRKIRRRAEEFRDQMEEAAESASE